MSEKDYLALACEATIEGIKKGYGGPFGATVVRNGEVIVAVANTMIKDNDPSAHAEMVAVREACKKLNTMDLSDCEVYATCEPCPMCAAVMIWANIKKVYYHSTKEEAADHGFSDMHLREYFDGSKSQLLEMVKVENRDDCDHLWQAFKDFQK